jgi:transposase
MQDNAPCHTSKVVTEFIEQTDFEFIKWPPYSPDLNPIENVWAWIKMKLYSEFPPAECEQDLIDYVFKCWADLDEEMCQRYCQNYNKRLLAVLNARGSNTKY